MKGVIAAGAGTIKIKEFPAAVLKAGDMLLSTTACGICATDLKSIQSGSGDGKYALGHEVVGRIVRCDENSSWEPGQRVVAAPYLPCGACFFCHHDQHTLCENLFEVTIDPGGLAEQIYVPADLVKRGIIAVPENLSDVQATLAEPLGCVVKGIVDARLHCGDTVLVIGDGTMGALTAAAVRAYGASPVIVAGMTAARLKTSRQHFADEVIDINENNIAEEVKKMTAGRGADVVFVIVSSGEALESGIQCVRPGGVVNAFAGVAKDTMIPLDVRSLHYRQYTLTGSFGTAPQYMARALKMLAQRQIDTDALITAVFPFSEIEDAVAHAVQRQGLKTVVIF